jgi:hypothetical protein
MMSKITKSANGQRCQIRLPGVCQDSAGVVWCHAIGQAAGKGIGMKVPDLLGAYGCSSCHDIVDRRRFVKHLTRMEIEHAFYEGVMRSQRILIDDGVVKI